MSYTIDRIINANFEEVDERVRQALTERGFGVLTEIDVTATLKIPEFWIPWVVGISCIVTALVVLHNLIHPGREMIEP